MPSRPSRIRYAHHATSAERRERMDKLRGTSTDRGYDAEWRRLRALFLKRNPFCICGCGGKSTEVDHILSVAERPDLRLVWSNLRAMTKACHSRRTALEQGFARSKK